MYQFLAARLSRPSRLQDSSVVRRHAITPAARKILSISQERPESTTNR